MVPGLKGQRVPTSPGPSPTTREGVLPSFHPWTLHQPLFQHPLQPTPPPLLCPMSPPPLSAPQHLSHPHCLSRCVSLCSKVMASPTGAGAVRAGPCRVLSTGPGAWSVWDESECTVGIRVTEVAGSTGTREGGVSGLTSPSRI